MFVDLFKDPTKEESDAAGVSVGPYRAMLDPKQTDKPKKYRSLDRDKSFGLVIALVTVSAVVIGAVLYVLTGERYKSAASIALEAMRQITP